MTDIERLLFLNSALQYRGIALGEHGCDPPLDLGLLPRKVFEAMERERRKLIRRLATELPPDDEQTDT